MLVIGIPTLNEADNIAHLVSKIDATAKKLGISIVIINSDNNSPDNTAEIFSKTKTECKKISLQTSEKGKGLNIFKILEATLSLNGLEGLALTQRQVEIPYIAIVADVVVGVGILSPAEEPLIADLPAGRNHLGQGKRSDILGERSVGHCDDRSKFSALLQG